MPTTITTIFVKRRVGKTLKVTAEQITNIELKTSVNVQTISLIYLV